MTEIRKCIILGQYVQKKVFYRYLQILKFNNDLYFFVEWVSSAVSCIYTLLKASIPYSIYLHSWLRNTQTYTNRWSTIQLSLRHQTRENRNFYPRSILWKFINYRLLLNLLQQETQVTNSIQIQRVDLITTCQKHLSVFLSYKALTTHTDIYKISCK
jgi:phenolic acid decarboxylase